MHDKINELSLFLEELKTRYLDKHLADEDELSFDKYDFDVRAYCVFAHAGIEQFFEELAEYALENLIKQWESGEPISKQCALSLISIAISQGTSKLHIEENEALQQERPLHYVGKLLRENQKALSQKVHKNHGASLKYLRALFVPLGIDVSPDANAYDALKRLANSRGAFAHRRSTPKKPGHHTYKPIDPEDALTAVKDCLKFCRELSISVPKSRNESFYSSNGLVRSGELAKLQSILKLISVKKGINAP